MFFALRYRKRLETLIAEWTQYRALVLNRMGAQNLQADEEKQFLALKGKVAENMTALTQWLNPNLAQEAQSHLRGIHQLLGRYPSLFAERPLDDVLRGEFERDWHDHFLFFHRLKGIKADPRARTQRTAAERIGLTPTEKVHKPSGGARFITVTLRLFFIVFLVGLFARFLPWEQLRGSSEAGGGLRGFLLVAGDRFKETFTGVRPPSLGGVLDPVVEAYGSEVTIILFGALILVVGYFLFIRMK